MRQIVLLFSLCLLLSFAVDAKSLKDEQLRYPRVREAYAQKEEGSKALFKQNDIHWPPTKIFWRAFKADKELELWAWSPNREKYVLLKSYDICSLSGQLGPKRKQGDRQIPEGFYEISLFNPASSFHLSIKVNYPNRSDRIRGEKSNLGGDIFVHGDCVTIGCLPMTDEEIKEIYLITLEAKSSGHKVPIHIFPTRLTLERMKDLQSGSPQLFSFWEELRPAYEHFEKTGQLPRISVAEDGRYQIVSD